jgi:serine/threonine protein kinase
MTTVPPVTAEVGSTANSYEILAKLATGGMAEIFLARGASGAGIERYVVLKRVLRNRASDAHFVRMFLDEARLAAQLQHPNIAQVYDLGKLGDSYFFTMEYVHGETVRALMNRSHALRRPIPIASVLTIIAGAAAGLHHAHERKDTAGRALEIVHRDVSPSNLMISYEGAVKVVDFGVAKAAHRSHETASGAVKGKIAYLSPEQCRASSEIDRRSDLFSLGIVMWELLTLERLYRRANDFDQMIAIVQEAPRKPSAVRPDIPPELDALVLKMLAKDPAARFQTADELHAGIEGVAVNTGSALSSASLGRFVRELFGQRPEPWVEMRSQDTHAEGVTVTSEPIPAGLAIPVADSVDLRLGGVPDLSLVSETSARQLAASEALPTVPVPIVAPAVEPPAESALDLAKTLMSSPPVMPNQTLMMPPPRPPMVVPAPRRAHEPRTSRTPLLVIGGFVVAAVGIAVAIATRGSADEHQLGRDPEMTVVEAPPPAPEPQVAPIETPVDAQPAVVAPAPTAAAPVASPPPAVVAEVPADAAPAHAPAEPVRPRPRPAPPAPPPPPPPKPSPAEELVKEFETDHFAAAAATCIANPTVAAQNPTACVLSACHLHDATHARKWVKTAGGKRAALVAGCAALKTVIEEVKSHDCDADPLSCQH